MIQENFLKFINTYKKTLSEIFDHDYQNDSFSTTRGITPEILEQLLECNPLSTFIPEEYGGRGSKTHESLAMLEATSYQSLPFSLFLGINGALFIQPLANFASEEVKIPIFRKLLNEKKLGGLMITEPDFGTDALKMQTGFTRVNDHYHISGLKHWAGLTGKADYWLIAAREKDEAGGMKRDIGFFVHETNNGGITVEEEFQNLGLYMIPYGRNRINIKVNESHRLQPKSTGINILLDLLYRSRLQFPGMATGFLHRILDEALKHCKNRFVGGYSLFSYDQVKERLAHLQSYFTASSAMSLFTSENIPLSMETSRFDLIGNSIKSVVTDYMQSAAQSFLQLVGAKGYKLNHFAGKAIVDSRPFQIFEGSNDILYQQITESVLKMMKKMQVINLQDFIKGYENTEKTIDYFKELFNFNIDFNMTQRKMVELGRAISRLIIMNLTIDLGSKGFNKEMITNSLIVIQQEVRAIVSTYKFKGKPEIIPEFDNSSWLSYLSHS